MEEDRGPARSLAQGCSARDSKPETTQGCLAPDTHVCSPFPRPGRNMSLCFSPVLLLSRPSSLLLPLFLSLPSLVFFLALSFCLHPHLSPTVSCPSVSMSLAPHFLRSPSLCFSSHISATPHSPSLVSPSSAVSVSFPHCLPLSPSLLGVSLPCLQSLPKLAQPLPTGSLVAARPLLVPTKFRCWSLGQNALSWFLHPGVCLLLSSVQSLLRPEARPRVLRKDTGSAAGCWALPLPEGGSSPIITLGSPLIR